MNDPWAWTTVWGGTVRAGGGPGRGGQRGKHWDKCKRTNKKKKHTAEMWKAFKQTTTELDQRSYEI